MKSIATLLAAGGLALASVAVTTTDAEARHRRGHRNAVPAIVTGVIGGILLNQAFRGGGYDPYYGSGYGYRSYGSGYQPYGYGYGYQRYGYGDSPRYRQRWGDGYRHRSWGGGYRGGRHDGWRGYSRPYGGRHAPEGSVTR